MQKELNNVPQIEIIMQCTEGHFICLQIEDCAQGLNLSHGTTKTSSVDKRNER
jgi:hypothetical protein